MHTHLPLAVLEALAEQRRPDPRILAAAGYPAPSPNTRRRLHIGDLLVRLGQRLQNAHRDITPAPKPA